MLAAIIPWQQQPLGGFVRASLYQGRGLIRNGGKDAEQVGLAAVRAAPSPLSPLVWTVRALWGGFWGSVRNPCFVSVLFFPPPLFCQGCASWEHFPCPALADAWGHRDVPALVCPAPIPEGRGMEETSGTNKTSCNKNQLRFALGGDHPWGIPIVPRACPVQQNSQKGFVLLLNSLFQEQRYVESPVVSCVLCCVLCFHFDIPKIALIGVFGELIKFPDKNCVFCLVCSWRGPSRASTW